MMIVYSPRSSPIRSSMRVVDRGIEGRTRLVHEDDLRADGDRPGDAQPLVLAAGEPQGRLVQPVLDLVPEGRAAEALLHGLVEHLPVARRRRSAGRRPRSRRSTWETASARWKTMPTRRRSSITSNVGIE